MSMVIHSVMQNVDGKRGFTVACKQLDWTDFTINEKAISGHA